MAALPKNTIDDGSSKEGLVMSIIPSFLKDITSRLSDLVFFSEYSANEIETLSKETANMDSELLSVLDQLMKVLEGGSDKEKASELSNKALELLEKQNSSNSYRNELPEHLKQSSDTSVDKQSSSESLLTTLVDKQSSSEALLTAIESYVKSMTTEVETHEEKIESEREEKAQTDLLKQIAANSKLVGGEGKPEEKKSGMFAAIAAGLLGLFGAKGLVLTIIKMLTGKGILATILAGITWIFGKLGALFGITALKAKLLPLLARLNPIGLIITGILVLFNGVKEFINKLFDGGSLLEALGAGLAGLVKTLTFGFVDLDGDKLGESLTNMWDDYIVPGFDKIVEMIGEGLSWLWTDGIWMLLEGLGKALIATFELLGKAVVLTVTELIPWLAKTWWKGVMKVFDGIAKIGGWIADQFLEGIGIMWEGLKGLGKKYITDPFMAWWEGTGISNFVKESIIDPIANIIESIKSLFSGVAEKIKGMISWIPGFGGEKSEEEIKAERIAELQKKLEKEEAATKSGDKWYKSDAANVQAKELAAKRAEETRKELEVLLSGSAEENSKERSELETKRKLIVHLNEVGEKKLSRLKSEVSSTEVAVERQPLIQERVLEISDISESNLDTFNSNIETQSKLERVLEVSPKGRSANGDMIESKVEKASASNNITNNNVTTVAPTHVTQHVASRPYIASPSNNTIGRVKAFQ